MEKKISTKEILAGMLGCQELIDDLGLELKNKTLLECFEEVIERARRDREYSRDYGDYFSLDDKLIAAKRLELETIAEEYGISEWQAALFAIVIELCNGEDIRQGQLVERLKTSFISYLSIEKDLRELEKKFLIKINNRDFISVSNEVIDLLRENKPFRKPSYEGLSTGIILSKMNRLFNDYDEGNIKLLLEELDNMILANPATSIAKTADSYRILIEGDKIIYPEITNDYLNSMK